MGSKEVMEGTVSAPRSTPEPAIQPRLGDAGAWAGHTVNLAEVRALLRTRITRWLATAPTPSSR
ncbi:hypothetical protein Ppa06_59710 [Planomonospora parontospora subsp. parontospora]|uniref:Uncharacterized protein n=2 Tax=Planomonospora parontospora TaxID=58119 RepID=A0AA37BMK0_9ACTN|nr:hypothetical protein GCM10010126_59240 [Planomonospora parontospora]GII12173.1 hypothetical protein Ppa06_59710 [Planomonospora parontospora subsp. parontospora]